MGCTEGGEALLESIQTITGWDAGQAAPVDVLAGSAAGSWLALWTHSRCEQLVHDQIVEKGFCVFLPKVDVWSRRRGVQRLIQTPMFPGYLFLRLGHAMDKATYVEVSRVRGLVRVLGEKPDTRGAEGLGRLVAQVHALRRMSVSVAGMLHAGKEPVVEAAIVKDVGTIWEQKLPHKARDLAAFPLHAHDFAEVFWLERGRAGHRVIG